MQFGRLKVIKWVKINKIPKREKDNVGGWLCECECGNTIVVRTNALTSRQTVSCGCYQKEIKNKKRNNNIYDLSGDFGIGYTINTNKQFYFDLDDYDLISKYAWSEHNGYVVACTNKKRIALHRVVMGLFDNDCKIVDHIGHNNFDNRKSKLRVTNNDGNLKNKSLSKNNTSGVTGVCWEKDSRKWHSYIWVNHKCLHLGRFEDFDDAVNARKQAENQYFGEYSYDNSIKIYNGGQSNENI